MKKLIYTAALTLAVASFNFPAHANTVNTPEPLIQIFHAVQFPKIVKPGNDITVRQSFSLGIPQTSRDLSQLTIDIPSGLNVGKDITISDKLQRKVKPQISINQNKIIMTFFQPVPPGTTLNISLNQVTISGVSNAWDYSVSAKFVGINTEIPVGVVQFAVY